MVKTVQPAGLEPTKIGAVASIEAEIRAKAKPLLSDEEERLMGAKESLLHLQLAEARCTEAADAQLERAADWAKQVKAMAQQVTSAEAVVLASVQAAAKVRSDKEAQDAVAPKPAA